LTEVDAAAAAAAAAGFSFVIGSSSSLINRLPSSLKPIVGKSFVDDNDGGGGIVLTSSKNFFLLFPADFFFCCGLGEFDPGAAVHTPDAAAILTSQLKQSSKNQRDSYNLFVLRLSLMVKLENHEHRAEIDF